MSRNSVATPEAQLTMPGMPGPKTAHARMASCCTVSPGQDVLYVGNIYGGPRQGSRGVVRQALRHKAIVDMGRSGVWHIPYYFLAVPDAA